MIFLLNHTHRIVIVNVSYCIVMTKLDHNIYEHV